MKLKFKIMKQIRLFIIFSIANIFYCLGQQNFKIEPYEFKTKSGINVNAEKGSFKVPENRLNDNSRDITLSFVRFKSTNPNPGAPIIYLAGGPGGSGISTARGERFELFMALREIADVIALDQRGTGMSNQIPRCKTSAYLPLETPGNEEVYLTEFSEAAKNCMSFWTSKGVDIDGYNTVQNSDDIEALRKVLKADKISLWGISYGSHLGFNYIKRYENNIDKVILAGIEGPDETVKLPNYSQEYLKRVDAKLKEDTNASKYYPDLLQLMSNVFDKLEKEPVYTEIKDRRSGKMKKLGIGKLDVQLVTSFFLTKNPKDVKNLPYLFYQMNKGDYSEISNRIAMLKQFAGRQQAMPLMMDAMSGVSKKRWGKIQKQTPKAILGRTTNFPFPDLGFKLNIRELGDDFRKLKRSSVKALFITGTLDGRTYIESAIKTVKKFKNSSHIIIDGAGHDSFMSTPKVKELMLSFLKEEKVPSQTITLKPLKFRLPK